MAKTTMKPVAAQAPRIVTIIIHGAPELGDDPKVIESIMATVPEADRALARIFTTSQPLDLSAAQQVA